MSNMKTRKFLSLLLTLAMVLTLLPVAAVHAQAAEVYSWDALSAAMAAGGDITLTGYVSGNTDLTVPAGTTVTLDLNGKRINRNFTGGPVITVEGTLTVTDSLGTGRITGGNGTYGGVYVASGGSFTLSGGRIQGNEAANGGGVYVDGGTFRMEGGSIVQNYASNGLGGGVYLAGGSFTMSGGTIEGNVSPSGSGVYVAGGTFSMENGVITNNNYSSSGNGGGVYVAGGIFTMSGGSITSHEAARFGGGVYVDGGTFTMTGGDITGNTCTSHGGAVYVADGGTFALSGNPEITGNLKESDPDNVYLSAGKTITITGELTNTSPIGVNMEENEGTFTQGLSDNGTAAKFSSDDSSYAVVVIDGEAALMSYRGITVVNVGEHGTVDVPASAPVGSTVTFTITVDTGYAVDTVSYNDGSEQHVLSPENGVYSFTMPATSVEITVTYVNSNVYVDAAGVAQPPVTEYSVIREDTETLTEGWWVVESDVTNNHRLIVEGGVNLILCNNKTLTVNGISVSGSNSLTIWAQSHGAGAGKLIANGGENRAAIGGDGVWTGTIVINGGDITAKGSSFGAGIGGGANSAGGSVTINNGNIWAQGGNLGAGIGGGGNIWNGRYGNIDSITITGGVVKAGGGRNAAGIGGGGGQDTAGTYGGSVERITITGGVVDATVGGIGSGASGAGSEYDGTVSEGIILDWTEASKDSMSVFTRSYRGNVILKKPFQDDQNNIYPATDAADTAALAWKTLTPYTDLFDGFYLIGPDWDVESIDRSKQFAENPDASGEYVLKTTLAPGDEIKVAQVTGNTIANLYPDAANNPYTVGAAYSGPVTISFKTSYDSAWAEFGGYFYIEKVPVHDISVNSEGAHGTVDVPTTAPVGSTVTFTVTANDGYIVNKVSYNDGSEHVLAPENGVYSFTMPDTDVTITVTYLTPGAYVDAAGVPQTPVTEYSIVDASTEKLTAGWWVVGEDVFNSNRLIVEGSVNLILCDNKTLTATNGIRVSGGNSLTIWAQSHGNDAGTLIASAEANKAAIGSDSMEIGTIVINGGIINATGGNWGAGIGGGEVSQGGSITINNGRITATGGYNAAGIGGGFNYWAGQYGNIDSITITGGVVNAESQGYGAGIGGGGGQNTGGSVERITITGGVINASNKASIVNGSYDGFGIGPGRSMKSSDYNGTVSEGIILGWTEASRDTMSVKATSYGGTVVLQNDFRDENNTVFLATDAAENEALADKTLTPYYDGFYLIRPDWSLLSVNLLEKFTENPDTPGEYVLSTTLEPDDQIKVVKIENGEITGWWPNGEGTQYHVDQAHAGTVNIYFKTDYVSSWSEFGGYFWIETVHIHTVTHVEAVEASCLEAGNIAYYYCSGDDCELSGKFYADEDLTQEIAAEDLVVPALGHDWGEWVVTAEPSCAEEGVETRTCSRCGEAETRPVDKLDHEWGEWVVTVEPSCAEEGVETRTCSRCGEAETRPVEKLDHEWGEWVVTTNATCTEDGELTHTCSNCGATETQVLPSLGHFDSDPSFRQENYVEPTPLTEGSFDAVYYCQVCGIELRREHVTWPANGTGFYLIGPDWTVDAINEKNRFAENPDSPGEYMLNTTLAVGDEIKVVKVENGAITAWYPGGVDNQYHVDTAYSGEVTIYFKTAYDDAWSAFGGHIYIVKKAAVIGHSISLKDEIAINFYLWLPSDYTAENTTVSFTWGEDTHAKTVDGTLYAATGNAATAGANWGVSCYVAAKDMTDDVTMTLTKGGETLTDTYSVVSYATDFAAIYANNDAMLTLLCDMLDYGAAAQTYFGYKTDALASGYINTVIDTANSKGNMDFSWTEKTALDSITLSGVNMSADLSGFGLTYIGASLMTTSKTAARLYFTANNGFDAEGLSITCGTQTLELKAKGSYYYVDISLVAKEIFTNKTVTFAKDGVENASLTYNAADYYNSILDENANYSDALKNVLKKMYNYFTQARTVLGA